MPKEFDPKHAAKHGYTLADWEAVDSPEIGPEEFETARPFAEVSPGPAAAMRRGRPKLDSPKVRVTMRLDADILDSLKADGAGWQTRANEALRKALGL